MDWLEVEIYVHDLAGRMTSDVRFVSSVNKEALVEGVRNSVNFPELNKVKDITVTNKLRFMDAANILNARINSDGTLESDVLLMNEKEFMNLRRAFSKIDDKRICIYAVGCIEFEDGTGCEFLAYKSMSDGLSYLSFENFADYQRRSKVIKNYEDKGRVNNLSIIERSLCYFTTE